MKKLPTDTWQATSAAVTNLTAADALKHLRLEATTKSPRPHLMRRLFGRWRIAQVADDQANLARGKLPWYLVP